VRKRTFSLRQLP